MRRYVVRPLVWALAVLGVLALGAVLLLKSALFRERVRVLVTTQLGEILDRQVTLGGIELSLLPLSVELRDLVIAGPSASAPPFAVVPRLVVEGDLTGLRDPVLHLRTVAAEGPVVHFEIGPDGQSTLPRVRRGSGGRRRLRVEVGSLAVRGGVVEFADLRMPLDLDARDTAFDLLATAEDTLAGLLTVGEVTVALPNAQPYRGRVEARVALDPTRLRIEQGTLSGPEFQGRFGGEVEWEGEPAAEFRIAATGSSELLVALGYVTDQIAGAFRFAGDVAWSPAGLLWQGEIGSDALRVLNWPLEAVGGQVRGDGRTVHLDLDSARYRGGRLAGDLDVDLTRDDNRTTIALTVAGVSAAGALEDLRIPVTAVASRLGGTVRYAFGFDAPERGDGAIALTLEAAAPAAGENPAALSLGGRAPFRIAGGVLTTDDLRLESNHQAIQATGRYDLAAGTGRFDWRVESAAVGELAVLLPPTPGEPAPLWLPSTGHGVLAGVLDIRPNAVGSEVTLALADVVAPGLRAASAEGTLRVTERAVRVDLRLVRGDADGALEVRGDIPIESGAVALGLLLEARNWPLAEAKPWLPAELAAWPLDGALTGRITLAGTLEAPRGSVDARLDRARLIDTEGGTVAALGRLDARFAFDPARVQLDQVAVYTAAGTITAAGSVGLAATGGEQGMALRIAAPSLALGQSPFAELLPSDLAGRLALEAEVGGSIERPAVRATLRAEDLSIGTRVLGDGGRAVATVDWDGSRLDAQGSVLGLATFSGGGPLTLQHADLRLAIESDALPRLADLAVDAALPEFTGRLRGELAISGPLGGPALPRIELTLPELELGYLGRTLRAREPVVVRLERTGLAIVSLYLGDSGAQDAAVVAPSSSVVPEADPAVASAIAPSGADSEIFLNGTLGLGGAAPALDLRMQATIAASWLGLVAPTVQPYGTFEALATIKGTTARPVINGQGGIRDGRLILLGFPHALDDLRATLLFYSDALVLDSLTARIGGGSLQAGGRIDLPRDGRIASYSVQANARDVTLRYPEGWLVHGDAELVLASSGTGRQLRGSVVLDRAYYLTDVKVGVTDLLRSALAPDRAQVAETDPFLAGTQLGITLRADDSLRVRNNLANLRGDADLVVRGTLARPAVFGRVEVEEGGTLVYAENEYQVERAVLTFANPYRIEPFVDVVAKTEVRNYDVTLNLSGTLERLNATFASDPPIADLEILSLLATGDVGTLSDVPAAAGTTPLTSGGAEAFLAGQAANLIGQRVNRLFGFDKFQVAPLQVGGDAVSSVRVTVGKRLGKDLFATYSVDPSGTLDHFLTLEWRISSALSLVVTQTGDAYAVDARWEKVF